MLHSPAAGRGASPFTGVSDNEQAAARFGRGLWRQEARRRVLQYGTDLHPAVVVARLLWSLPVADTAVFESRSSRPRRGRASRTAA